MENIEGLTDCGKISVSICVPPEKEAPPVELSDDDGCVAEKEEAELPPVPAAEVLSKEMGNAEMEQQGELKQQANDALEDGNLEVAVAKLTEAIGLGGVFAMMVAKRAEVLMKQKRYRAVVADATLALSLNPDSGKAYRFRGRRFLGDYDGSSSDLSQAQDIDYDDGVADLHQYVQKRVEKLKLKDETSLMAVGHVLLETLKLADQEVSESHQEELLACQLGPEVKKRQAPKDSWRLAFEYFKKGKIDWTDFGAVPKGLPEKVGKRMHRTLLKHLNVFSDKQQRYLKQSALAREFSLETPKPPQDKELAEAQSTSSKPKRPRSSEDEDAASKMEEMMARCRAFVREKAPTYDEREKEVEEKALQAAEEERIRLAKEKKERYAREWAQIADWHAQMEGWEAAQMAANDVRAQQRAKEAREAREAKEAAQLARERSRSRRRKEKRDREEVEDRDRRRSGQAPEEDNRWQLEEQRLAEELGRAEAQGTGYEQRDFRPPVDDRRSAEERWQDEQRHQAELRQQEEARWQAQQDQLRLDEEARWQAQQRQQEETRWRTEQQHREQQDRRWADQQQWMEEQRWHADQRRIEEERWWAEQRHLEQERQRAFEAEQWRLMEEQKQAQDLWQKEESRRAEQRAMAEERRRKEEQRRIEERLLNEERRQQEETRRVHEERRLAEQAARDKEEKRKKNPQTLSDLLNFSKK
ncbi:unnamed protein product [Polarella glacialis]|uniref:Uncharacterized protein n=1 Tax=Polarella glacialis TaxID=89957 RepID=A0A813IFB1_POLGL|nr:unnamed protein product [Polarella glacialis]